VSQQWQQFQVGQFGAVTEHRSSERRDGTLSFMAQSVTAAARPS
jgi:hypothetical protein